MDYTKSKSDQNITYSKAYKNYVLFILLLIAVFNYADRFMIGILIPDIKDDLNLSDTQLAIYVVKNFDQLKHKSHNTVRRWFSEIRLGLYD